MFSKLVSTFFVFFILASGWTFFSLLFMDDYFESDAPGFYGFVAMFVLGFITILMTLGIVWEM